MTTAVPVIPVDPVVETVYQCCSPDLVAFKPSPYHSTKPVWCVSTAATSLNDFKPVFRHFILPVAGTENITAYFSDLWDGYSISGVVLQKQVPFINDGRLS